MSDQVKILAFHLPQFHAIAENDEWWGKGFTEWVNVKKAQSLFEGHNQPRVPKEGYYNLLEETSIRRQMELARENGIYGFCYYHYWFNGKLLLEKPLEKMRTMAERVPYCFCWANEPWARTWDGRANEVLMPQFYGGEPEWEQHFVYLLDFFRDEKYIKQDGKPVLVLYRTNNIPDCEAMIDYLNTRCVEEGFAGIYIIEERNSFQGQPVCANSNAVLDFEPMYTLTSDRPRWQRAADKLRQILHNKRTGNQLLLYRYQDVWSRILKRNHAPIEGKAQLSGGFVDWDNTPRKGKKGLVILGAEPERFGKYLAKLLKKAEKEKVGFVFINAWNEWGEGTYLEPDEANGTAYLDVIRRLTMPQE